MCSIETQTCSLGHHVGRYEDTHSGEEHGEDVHRSLQQVVASNGDDHRRNKHQITETEQEGGEELETVGVGF